MVNSRVSSTRLNAVTAGERLMSCVSLDTSHPSPYRYDIPADIIFECFERKIPIPYKTVYRILQNNYLRIRVWDTAGS